MDAARSDFHQDFFNCVHEYTVFNPLERQHTNIIVKLQVTSLQEHTLFDMNITTFGIALL
jgi:ATP-dependent Clp protease ATP-binding subunit ClpA